MLLIAATDRPIRFLMFNGIYEHPLIKPFAKILKIIPICLRSRPARDDPFPARSLAKRCSNGEVVCIFPEGQITRIGQMLPFRRGFERIMKGVDAPIVPVNIDGIWGCIFSFAGGRFLWKLPRRFRTPLR